MPIVKYYILALFILFGGVSNIYAEIEYKYSYLPKKVYENQIFPITILEIGSHSTTPHFFFDTNSDMEPIGKKPLVVKNGNDTFFTFYFKSIGRSITIPSLRIKNTQGIRVIEAKKIPIAKLKPREDFCGVLSADMKIKTSQSSTYDERNNLVTLSIEAYEANIENMHLRNVIESGIEQISRDNAKVVAEFYVVVPSTQKRLKFTYFNTIKQQYIFLEMSIDIKDSTVSTQSKLNPKNSSFDKFKKYTFIFFSTLFLLLYIWKRDIFYIILMIVSLIILFTFYIPKDKICVSQGSSLYILPTNSSRVYAITDEKSITDLLGKRADFNKIEYSKEIIGWIKDEDICKN
jgi:hypothetical protein